MKEFERGDGGVSARFGRAGLRDTTIVGIDARDVKEKKYVSTGYRTVELQRCNSDMFPLHHTDGSSDCR